MEEQNLNEIIVALRKEGKIPQNIDCKYVDGLGKLSKEDVGKLFVFKARISGVGIKLSPRIQSFIKFEEEEDDEVDMLDGMDTTFLDNKVKFSQGYLINCDEQKRNNFEHRDYFNRVISLMNIIGIPFDFVSTFDIIIFMKSMDGENVDVITSDRARTRGISYDVIKITQGELAPMLLAMYTLWESIKESKMLEAGHIYTFLGYCRYYYFHRDFLLSFINGWMFIEAMVNLIWEKNMVGKGFDKAYLADYSRNWTTQIKTDELYMIGYFDKPTKTSIQELRNKRNKVFHVEKREKKREIIGTDARTCFIIGLRLFYKYIGFEDDKKVIDFTDITNKFYNAIHKNPTMYLK